MGDTDTNFASQRTADSHPLWRAIMCRRYAACVAPRAGVVGTSSSRSASGYARRCKTVTFGPIDDRDVSEDGCFASRTLDSMRDASGRVSARCALRVEARLASMRVASGGASRFDARCEWRCVSARCALRVEARLGTMRVAADGCSAKRVRNRSAAELSRASGCASACSAIGTSVLIYGTQCSHGREGHRRLVSPA
jgi:hypothetical protein